MSIIDPSIKKSLVDLYTSGTLNDFKSLYICQNSDNISSSVKIDKNKKNKLYDYLKSQYINHLSFTLEEINNLFNCISEIGRAHV